MFQNNTIQNTKIQSINSLCIYFVCFHHIHTECMLHKSRRLFKFFFPLLCLQRSKWCLTYNRSPINTFERIFQNIEIFVSKIFTAVKKSSNKWAGEVREPSSLRGSNYQTKPCEYGNGFFIFLSYAEIHF